MQKDCRMSLSTLLHKRRRRIIGLMSGTSADGLDLAAVDVRDSRGDVFFHVDAVETIPYPPAMRKIIHQLMDSETCTFETLVRLHYRWAEFAAEAVREFMRRKRIAFKAVAALACHGQTIAHYPEQKRFLGGNSRGTFQIGDGAVLAQLTGIPTVGDFRWSDIAAGGSGAPLSGYYHHLMLARMEKQGTGRPPLAVLNIGGMANLSLSSGTATHLSITAFDTGPGNCLSDTMMQMWGGQPFDHDGDLAARGTINDTILKKMLRHAYFHRCPPKSCGREEFGTRFIFRFYPRPARTRDQLAERLATVDELVACTIARAQKWLGKIGGVVVVGGGRHNRHLMRRIGHILSPIPLISCDYLGLPGDFIEAIGFALLAHETLSGRPGNLGGATGGRPAILGKICLPEKPGPHPGMASSRTAADNVR